MREFGISTQAADACGSIGVAYEGGEPALLTRMLPFVDYLEVTLESVAIHQDGHPRLDKDVIAELKELDDEVNIVVHGVGLSIGSHDGWSPDYFPLLDAFLDQIKVAWHSEHLAYTQVDGQFLGIMLTMPRTNEALDLVCNRVEAIQRTYPLPFLLEHVVHVVPPFDAPFTPAGFLNELARRTGCGVILDPYNLQCDAHNHGLSVDEFLSELDTKNIKEIHMAGGVLHNGFRHDVHSRLTDPSTVDIGLAVARHLRNPGLAVIYEFMPEAIPNLGHDAIVDELRMLRQTFGVAS